MTWAAIIIGLWLLGIWLGKRRNRVAADRPDIPYKVFTDEFDIVCRGRDVSELLMSDGDVGQFPHDAKERSLDARIATADDSRAAYALQNFRAPMPFDELEVAFILDLSGSIANDLPAVVGNLEALVAELEDAGVKCAVYGFTTRGWRGGLAREKWINTDGPKYPGRLCALLHIVIKEFGQPSDQRDWHGILRADVLKENVDGEAMRWAADRLVARAEPRKWLIAISDGAPVDDSTLQENGADFLFRDWQAAVEAIQSDGQIAIGAIGLRHSVEPIIPDSISIGDPGKLGEAFVDVARRLGSNSQQKAQI